MIESRSFIHVPKSIRIITLLILGIVLLGSVFMAVYFLKNETPATPKFTEWILLSISLVQMALTGFAVALILFYTERELGTDALRQKTDQFLEDLMPKMLRDVSPSYEGRHEGCKVTKLGRSDIFGAAYLLEAGGHSLRVWVGLNVNRLIVIYWLAVDDDEGRFIEQIKGIYRYTFGGAEKVGFATFYEPIRLPDGGRAISIWSSVRQGENLLLQPSDRLFWMQDIAMMTESFWRTSIRNGIRTSDLEPGPL